MQCDVRPLLALFAVLMAVALASRLYSVAHAPYQCEMSYMWPSYEPVSVTGAPDSHYRLLQYKDGGVDAQTLGASCGYGGAPI